MDTGEKQAVPPGFTGGTVPLSEIKSECKCAYM